MNTSGEATCESSCRDVSDLVVYAGNNKSGMGSMDEEKQKEVIKKMSEEAPT